MNESNEPKSVREAFDLTDQRLMADQAFQKWRRERQTRLFIVMAVLLTTIGLLFLLLSEEFLGGPAALPYEFVRGLKLLGPILVLAGVGVVSFWYLQTGFKSTSSDDLKFRFGGERPDPNEALEISVLRKEVGALREYVSSAEMGERNQDDLVQSLKKKLVEDAATSVIGKIESKIAKSAERQMTERDFHERISETRSRLAQEIKALQRRGNFNLGHLE